MKINARPMPVIGGNTMDPSTKDEGGGSFDILLEKVRYMATAHGIPCIGGTGIYGSMQLTEGRMRSNASARVQLVRLLEQAS